MQLPNTIVMVRPASFGFNPETASTILFQREPTEISRRDIERRARIEFDMLAGRLREAGVEIILVEDMEELHTPDAVFPNNWVSFHHGRSGLTRVSVITTVPSSCTPCSPRAAGRSEDGISSRSSNPAVSVCRALQTLRITKTAADSWRERAAWFSIT